jgi:hypothetical protein
MTQGAELAKSSSGRDADLYQAEYFWRLLDGRKVEVCEALEAELDALARFQRAGDLTGVRSKRRIVRVLEAELRTLDQLLVALRIRLGLPTLRRTSSAINPVAAELRTRRGRVSAVGRSTGRR